jgi:hypothetical protein
MTSSNSLVAPIGSALIFAAPDSYGLSDAQVQCSAENPASLSQKNGGAAPFATPE